MTTENMKKVPSYLKGLVATRARADATVQRLEVVMAEVQTQLERARRERDASDTLIVAYSPDLDPSSIEPVNGWRGKYGERGAVICAIREFVRSAHPDAVTTTEVAVHLVMKFEMDFISPQARASWKKTTVRNRLQRLAVEGVVERLPLSKGEHSRRALSWWRWIALEHAVTLDCVGGAALTVGVHVGRGTTGNAV